MSTTNTGVTYFRHEEISDLVAALQEFQRQMLPELFSGEYERSIKRAAQKLERDLRDVLVSFSVAYLHTVRQSASDSTPIPSNIFKDCVIPWANHNLTSVELRALEFAVDLLAKVEKTKANADSLAKLLAPLRSVVFERTLGPALYNKLVNATKAAATSATPPNAKQEQAEDLQDKTEWENWLVNTIKESLGPDIEIYFVK